MRRTWGLVVVLGAFWATTAQAQTATFRVELRAEFEIRAPEAPEQPLGLLPIVEERLRTVIDGQYATTELTQVFHNRSRQTVEGRYVVRPSLDARVQGFAYYIGEERVEGEVLPRQSAREVYRQVTEQRRDPAILEQTGDGEFSFRVFPIAPGENKRVEMRFGEWLRRRGSSVTYRVPLSAPETSAEVVIQDARAAHVRSPTHAIDVEPIAGGIRVRSRGRLAEGGELVLRWEVVEPDWTPNVWVHHDEGHEGYFLLSLAAPEGFEDRVSAKDVTLVLDRSGSMEGEAIAHARAAASDIIRRLGSEDRVNVIAFDDDASPLFARPREADVQTRADALSYVARLRSGGGTDIAFALDRALSSQHDSSARPQVVIFITDGQSAPAPALEVAARDRRDVRVFTVGVGTGVNRALLSRLAAVKRGTATFIDHASRIEAEVGHLYAQIAHPLLVGLSLELEGGVASRLYPRSLPDLFVDDEVVIAGRFRAEGPVRFVLRGRLGDQEMVLSASASAAATGRRAWVGRRWAAGRVDHLLEQIQLEGEQPELHDEVLSLALAYNMVTPYTAFLAIPERELTAEAAQTLGRGRSQRIAAQGRHADARALRSNIGTRGTAIRDESYDSAESEMAMAPAVAAGCASCSVGGRRPPPAATWGIALLLGLALTRRRSAR